MVVETMMREKLSYREAARQFEIRDHNRVASWERIYLMEGAEGLYIERIPKKIAGLGSGERATPAEKVMAIQELRQEHKLAILLEIAQIPRATFYYHAKFWL